MTKMITMFHRWLQGELHRDELHELEREALDLEFLGDAMEGITLYHTTALDRINDQLTQKLSEKKIQKKKSIIVMYWPYAAAASLVLVLSTFFLLKEPTVQIKTSSLVADAATSEDIVESADDINEVATEESAPAEEKENIITNNPSVKSVPPTSSPVNTFSSPIVAKSQKEEVKEQIVLDNASESAIESIASSELPVAKLAAKPSGDAPAEVNTIVKKEEIKLAPQSEVLTSAPTISQKPDKFTLTRALSQDAAVQPVMGAEAFDKILRDNPFPKEWLFMRGLKNGDTYTIQFELDNEGFPTRINGLGLPADILDQIMKLSGKWTAPEGSKTIRYPLKVYTQ